MAACTMSTFKLVNYTEESLKRRLVLAKIGFHVIAAIATELTTTGFYIITTSERCDRRDRTEVATIAERF